MSDKIRLLVCNDCGSVDELPPYEGPPEYDEWLNTKTAEHQTASGEPHIGNLATIDYEQWTKPGVRQQIVDEIYKYIRPAGFGAGLGESHYDTRDNFTADAFACWKGFGRTQDPAHCDYKKDSKRLLPDTRAERKAEGLDTKNRPNIFLCDFCPLGMKAEHKEREAAGQYK